MSNNLKFDLTVDKAAQKVYISREFAAPLPLVWDAYTRQDILDKWWAPKPFSSMTKVMDFEVGGRRFYAMVSPEGMERWAVQRFTSITPKTNFKYANNFADKDENLEIPGSDWDITFSEESDITTVRTTIYNESPERLEKMIEMGFREGYGMIMNNLEELLGEQV